ncbi:hypothetical protein [Candidatus Contubernalis alkaliaceticus]|uniref:hypothetical protein n=1 Tax=Candidatus Contubernalis alkaliaceticus TaxID=338645 RepID=UPI001F4C0D51|nr:hypothetical protein [Candidatus Contubernalis alkalaceticus]UNC92333.1 hypothetical protein HUE98_09615 [Candidatus Contubernalis alkalaceticus]
MIVNEHRIKVPWHFWLIGLFFVFIYAIGAYDYFMMLGLNEAYYSYNNFGKGVYAYFTNYPMLPLIFWTTNIFSGIVAPILLFFRLRWAVQASFISVVSIMLLQFITFGFMDRWNVFGTWLSLFDIVIMLTTFGFFLYCRAMAKRGVLI